MVELRLWCAYFESRVCKETMLNNAQVYVEFGSPHRSTKVRVLVGKRIFSKETCLNMADGLISPEVRKAIEEEIMGTINDARSLGVI